MAETKMTGSDNAMRFIRYGLIALLFFGTALNYLDRQVLALLKPTLQMEFGWTDREFGHFGSAFQIATAVALLGVGWFIDRFGVRWGYGLAVAIWSLAGMGHAFASSVGQFVAARVTLAVAESVNTPAAMKSAATYLPIRERSIGIGVINSASNIGAILAPLTVPWIAITYGWREAFIITGALGFVWLVFWWLGTAKLQPLGAAAPTAGNPAVKGARRSAAPGRLQEQSCLQIWSGGLFFSGRRISLRGNLGSGRPKLAHRPLSYMHWLPLAQ